MDGQHVYSFQQSYVRLDFKAVLYQVPDRVLELVLVAVKVYHCVMTRAFLNLEDYVNFVGTGTSQMPSLGKSKLLAPFRLGAGIPDQCTGPRLGCLEMLLEFVHSSQSTGPILGSNILLR